MFVWTSIWARLHFALGLNVSKEKNSSFLTKTESHRRMTRWLDQATLATTERSGTSSHHILVSTFLYSWTFYRNAWDIDFSNLTLKTLLHLFSMPTEISWDREAGRLTPWKQTWLILGTAMVCSSQAFPCLIPVEKQTRRLRAQPAPLSQVVATWDCRL